VLTFREEVFKALAESKDTAFVTFARGNNTINRAGFAQVVDALFHVQVSTVMIPHVVAEDAQTQAVNAVLAAEAAKMVFVAPVLEERLFLVMDANQDGGIDQAEYDAAVDQMVHAAPIAIIRVANGDAAPEVHVQNVTALVEDVLGACSSHPLLPAACRLCTTVLMPLSTWLLLLLLLPMLLLFLLLVHVVVPVDDTGAGLFVLGEWVNVVNRTVVSQSEAVAKTIVLNRTIPATAAAPAVTYTLINCPSLVEPLLGPLTQMLSSFIISAELSRRKQLGEDISSFSAETVAGFVTDFEGFNTSFALDLATSRFMGAVHGGSPGMDKAHFADFGVRLLEDTGLSFSDSEVTTWASGFGSILGLTIPSLELNGSAVMQAQHKIDEMKEIVEASLRLVLNVVFDACDLNADGVVSIMEFEELVVRAPVPSLLYQCVYVCVYVCMYGWMDVCVCMSECV
jgi:hypothetical protein